ncbi:MAG: three-Cys-motif partner protein TcmP [FCB group bacterium]|nr:three-Cys-motif partner protein TcmP [FCB group bacterium]
MKFTTYNLREITNKKCITNCNPEKRKDTTNNDICKITKSELDELPVRCVGDWAYQKIYRLNQYFGIFSNGMKNRWNGLNYIELCSGLGRCVLRKTGEEIDGTSLSILRHPSFSFIKKAFFIDNDKTIIKTLNKRIKHLSINNAYGILGNYNDLDILEVIFSNLKKDSLNLVFIDPTDCSVPFETIKFIKEYFKNVDFIMNFPYGTDLIRNIKKVIKNPSYPSRKKYLKFLGSEDYFERDEVKNLAESSTSQKLVLDFFKEYKENLDSIGLEYCESEQVKNYYMLLFASSHSKGLEFWRKSQSINPNEQREIDFN